jgi:hypothetical protein
VAAALAHGNQEIDVNHHRDWSALIDSMNVYSAAKALSQPTEQATVIDVVEVKAWDDT